MKTHLLVTAALVFVGLTLPSVAQANDVVTSSGNEIDSYPTGSSKTFYPYVHEGFKDSFQVEIDFSDQDTCASGTYAVRVLNQSTGTVVRFLKPSTSFVPDNFPTKYVSWDGRNNIGVLVSDRANYTMRVTATFDCTDQYGSYYSDQVVSEISNVNPTTGYRTTSHTIHRWGRYATAHGVTGWCLSQPDGYGWTLNCAGTAGSAWATYAVTRPMDSVWSGWAFEDDSSGPVYYSHTDSGRTRTFKVRIGGYSWADATTPVVFYYKTTVRI